ncbi:MAG: peptidase S24, partial [Xanthobacteraceae bacterium]
MVAALVAAFAMKVATIGDRLKQQRARLGSSQVQMARAAGIPIDSYKKYEGDAAVPGGDALAGLARAGVDVTDLLIGEQRGAPAHSPHRVEQLRAGYVYLPLFDVRASAGGGELVEDENIVDVLAFKEEWIHQELHAAPGDLRLIFVEGDSMVPDLHPGDIILIDHTDTTARREGAYVIRMDGALLVKSLQRLPGGVIKVISRNPAY